LVEVAVREISRRHNYPILCTLTFADNLTDKAEARRRWKALRERILRRWPDLEAVGVWQRQARGAWHLHLVVSHPMSAVELREKATACGWGVQMRLDFIDKAPQGYRRGQGAQKVGRYVTRYIVRDLEEEDSGECLTVWIGTKNGTTAFHWNGGMAYLRRRGLDFLQDMEPDHRRSLVPAVRWQVEAPHWLLVRLGWESLSWEQRKGLYHRYDAVAKWAHGPPEHGNELEPF
jgi:hypothetical protein